MQIEVIANFSILDNLEFMVRTICTIKDRQFQQLSKLDQFDVSSVILLKKGEKSHYNSRPLF